MTDSLASIKSRLNETGDINEAISSLTSLLNSATNDSAREQLLIERGMLSWRLQKRADAINDYNAAKRLNPTGKASELLEQAYMVLDFYNKDLFNP